VGSFGLVENIIISIGFAPKPELCPLPQKKSGLCKKNNLICDYEKTK
jgi:hypothetical protein